MIYAKLTIPLYDSVVQWVVYSPSNSDVDDDYEFYSGNTSKATYDTPTVDGTT